jgi:membrane protease YdiL (CAAX protease family)
VLAPLSEEILFRRLIFVGLWQASGRLLSAAVISGLFFAIVHPPAGFPLILGVGYACAMLWARYRSLAPCIAFHMAFNSLQLAMLMVMGR